MKKVTISIAIVNYNGVSLLPECLDAALNQSLPAEEIVVVDNGSTDNSVAFIRENYPSVNLVINEENFYFCKGSNIAINSCSSDFILLLNNDCILGKDYLRHSVKPMLEDERVGATSGRINRIGGDFLDACGQLLARNRKPADRGYGEQDAGQYGTAEQVLSPGGVAPLLRKSMLKDIALDGQYFDEDFVQYYEDLDLFWRANNLGWKCWYQPEAKAQHYRGASGQSEKAESNWLSQFAFANLPLYLQGHVMKNRWMVMVKNDRLGSWLAALPWVISYEIKVLAYITLVRPALFRVYWKGLKQLKTAKHKRRRLKAMAIQRGQNSYGGI